MNFPGGWLLPVLALLAVIYVPLILRRNRRLVRPPILGLDGAPLDDACADALVRLLESGGISREIFDDEEIEAFGGERVTGDPAGLDISSDEMTYDAIMRLRNAEANFPDEINIRWGDEEDDEDDGSSEPMLFDSDEEDRCSIDD